LKPLRSLWYKFSLPKSWLILLLCVLNILAQAQVTFVIDDLPKTTPPHDSIFICGTFNNWKTDPQYQLHKRVDGKLAITLNIDSTFEYKFHRGDWAKVETSSRNQYMPNRKFSPGQKSIVYVSVANWQDLGGAKPFEIISFYFFALVFLALAAAYFLTHIKNKKKARTKRAITFLVFLSLILLGRVVMEVISMPWQFQVGLLGDVALLVGGPLWFDLVSSALRLEKLSKWHWVPAAFMCLVFLLRFFNLNVLSILTYSPLHTFITWDDIFLYVISLISVAFYFFAALRLWPSIKKAELRIPETSFFRALYISGGIFAVVLLLKVSVFSASSESVLLGYNRNLLPATLGVLVLVMCYYVFTYDEIFRATQQVLKKSDDLVAFKNQLHHVMKEQRVFTNPHLTLNELSDMVKVKPHVLSKIINDYYHQNFRDFVNGYRIEEFIELANQGASKRFTFLALAFEVGFNSKSTFNVAFKKMMNVTPRQYFHGKKGNSLKNNDLKSVAL
jgi:AraC-like DNA-binding protein